MAFGASEWLWLLLALPALAAVGAWLRLRRNRALGRFAGGAEFAERFRDQVSGNRRVAKQLLLAVVFTAAVLALAEPRWGMRLEPVTRRGSDVVVVLDTSLSMAAEDLAPSRFEQARHAIGTLLGRLSGDRVALVTVSGQARLLCPLTVDHAAVRLFLDVVEIDESVVPGTTLGGGLREALRVLAPEPELSDRSRAVIVFTDGEDHEGGFDEAIEELARRGVPVHVVGCGTLRGGPIPLRDASGTRRGFKKDRAGRVVTTRLEQERLESFAMKTGGRFYRASPGELEIEELARVLSSLEGGELDSTVRTRYEARFQWPLLIGWLALVAESWIGDRRRTRRPEEAAG